MPVLFKREFVEKILSGEKSATRRRWKSARVKVGRIYQARTDMFGKPFARLRILHLRWERVPGGSSPAEYLGLEACWEGFPSWSAFGEAFRAMHGPDAMNEPCYRVEFEVVREEKKR